MGRIVMIGDVGGHPDQLAATLAGLGASDGELPDDTVVIQVGDLVDRGPDSNAVLGIVQRHLERSPQRWVQLVGNHESQYLSGGHRFWPESLSDWDADRLRAWWGSGAMRVAAAVRTADGDDLLVTHAGLTRAAWTSLGEPATAATAARLLNQRPEPLLWQGGSLAIDDAAGPLWAEAGWELHEPWLEYHAAGGLVPFGQVHGHSTLVRYADRTWRCPGRVRQRSTVDWETRQVRTRVGGRVFIGIDPKHGRYGAPAWAPLVLAGATVLGPVHVG